MEHISFLSDRHILTLLFELLLILGLAKLLSIPLKRAGLSSLPAELLVGILLGPTVFGRFFPGLWKGIFPNTVEQHFMLDTIGWLGILFVLLTVGMELNISSAWRLRRQVLGSSIASILLPLTLAVGLSFLIPAEFFPKPEQVLVGRMLIAILLSVLSLPIALRTMGDIGILKSDFGMVAAGSFSVMDLLGWLVLMSLLSFATEAGLSPIAAGSTALGLAVFLLVSIIIAFFLRKVFNPLDLVGSNRHVSADFSILVIFGLVFGLFSTMIGVHAFFGFFLAGVILGASRLVREHHAASIGTFMEAIFVPVFFASAGLRIDYASNFDPLLFVLFSFLAMALRFAGAFAGSMTSRMPGPQRLLFSVLNTPGGEFHIIGALLAFDAGIIDDRLLVGIIGGTLVSSLVVAPLASLVLRTRKEQSILDFLPATGVIHELTTNTRDKALDQICREAAVFLQAEADPLLAQVMNREASVSTALGRGLAFPHARIKGLDHALIIPSRSRYGIDDWESPDGKPVHLVFLILSPAEKEDMQLQILRQLVKTCARPDFQESVMAASNDEEFYLLLRQHFSPLVIGLA